MQGVKADILQAISDKGVTVPAGSALDDCPGLIGQISGGYPYIPQTLVNKLIFGQQYKCVEIASGVFFPIQNLNYVDENIKITNNFNNDVNVPACAYYDYAQTSSDGYYYNDLAKSYIYSMKDNNMRDFDNNYFNLLMDYLKNLINSWLGKNINLSNTLETTFVKGAEFDTYEDWLGIIDIGIKPYGYFGNSWTKYPYGYNKPVYFGVTSKKNVILDIYEGKYLRLFTGSDGGYAYPMRFIIDEN